MQENVNLIEKFITIKQFALMSINNMNFYTFLWFLFWIIVFLGVLFEIDSVFFFGFIIWYIMLFPIDNKINTFFTISFLTNSTVSLLIIIFLIILWIFVFFKSIKKFPMPSEKLKSFSKKFKKIWILPIDIFVHVIILRIDVVHNFVKFVVKNAKEKLDTNEKKLWFFGFTLFLPRILTFSALWYDIFIENQLIWSPVVGLLLIVPIVTKLIITILAHYCEEGYNDYGDYIIFVRVDMTEEVKELIKNTKVLGPGNYGLSEFTFKRPCKKGIEKLGINFFETHFFHYSSLNQWFKETKTLLDLVGGRMLLVFLTLSIITKIYELCLLY